MIRRVALAASMIFATSAHAITYTFEANYTQGVVRWNHLGFSNPAAQFGQGEGTLEFDEADPAKASVKVTIPLASLSTSVPDLNEHLRSADFFETAKFPTATFTSTRVEKGATPEKLKVAGELSLHGVTKPVTLEVALVGKGVNPRNNLPTLGFEATTTLKRSDFGLGKFIPQVSDEIPMQITAQAVDAKAYAQYLKAEEAAEKAAAAKDTKKQ
jgi:polyisoprenoid-binding protein YceI